MHIVSAVYGDLREGADGARRCDATAVLVQKCERKDKCDIGELAVLCGYDPAPFAENRDKTLLLTYSCVSSVDNRYWNRLQRNREVSLNDSSFTVRLHSKDAGVICNAVDKKAVDKQ